MRWAPVGCPDLRDGGNRMRTGHWRVAGAGGLAVGLALAGTAAMADPPTTEVWKGVEVFCTTGDGEDPSLQLDVLYDDTTGEPIWGYSYAQIGETLVWSESPMGALDESGSWSMRFDYLTGDEGDAAGSLVAEGGLVEVGDMMTIDEKYKEGNVLVKVQGLLQPLAADGEVTSTDGLLDAFTDAELTCQAGQYDITFWSTRPATQISRGAGESAYCEGEDWMFTLDAFGEEAYATYVDGIVRDEETGEWLSSSRTAQGTLAVAGDHISGTLEVVEPPPVGDPEYVVVDLAIGDLLDQGTSKYSTPRSANHVKWEIYSLTGTLTLPEGETVDVDCTYDSYTYWERFSEKAGQKPGGKPPVNDLPGNALTLPAGASSRVNTRGAALEPEVPCTLTFDEEEFVLPFGRTIWYKVTGTGEDVLLSTAGTSFDTVMGVYTADFAQLACVDDSEETGLQASLLLPTEAGTTYLVQVGGFDGQFGQVTTSRQ